MKKSSLTFLVLSACTPKKEVQAPEVTIPEIKTVLEEVIPDLDEEQIEVKKTDSPRAKYCDSIDFKTGGYLVYMKGWELVASKVVLGSSFSSLFAPTSIPSSWKHCTLKMYRTGVDIHINDEDCDKTADTLSINLYDIDTRRDNGIHIHLERTQLEELGDHERFDNLLGEAQKYICPENKQKFYRYIIQRTFNPVDEN